MIIAPPINELTKKVPCRYSLVVVAAKRARQIVNGSAPLVKTNSDKPVSIALHEIVDGAVGYESRDEQE